MLWEHEPQVLPNFHECLYNSIKTRRTCFLLACEYSRLSFALATTCETRQRERMRGGCIRGLLFYFFQKTPRREKGKQLVKVIPQKLNFPVNFFETFLESSLLSTVSKTEIKMIGHHSRLRDMMGQSCPIYACPSAYRAHYLSVHLTFYGSSKHTLLK